jgi:hypothetical protein
MAAIIAARHRVWPLACVRIDMAQRAAPARRAGCEGGDGGVRGVSEVGRGGPRRTARRAGAFAMKPLSGLDGAFLHLETPETPMHVASLHVFELPPGYRGDFHADIKRLMARRLHVVPVFERKLAAMPLQLANPAWVHDAHVDLDYHVQRVTLSAPGGQAELEAMAARLHGGPGAGPPRRRPRGEHSQRPRLEFVPAEPPAPRPVDRGARRRLRQAARASARRCAPGPKA